MSDPCYNLIGFDYDDTQRAYFARIQVLVDSNGSGLQPLEGFTDCRVECPNVTPGAIKIACATFAQKAEASKSAEVLAMKNQTFTLSGAVFGAPPA